MHRSAMIPSHDGTPIWGGIVGEGPALVLCDGFACDGFIWPYIIDHFCEEYQVVRWHYRGHGRSGTPEDRARLTIEDLYLDLRAVLDHFAIEGAILAGHSMGAQVILESWARMPERIRALVPICGTFAHPLHTFKNTDLLARALPFLEKAATAVPGALQALWTSVATSRISYLIAQLTEVNASLIRGEDFRPYLEHTAMMDVRTYVAMLHHLAEHSAEEILPTIEVPTLVIASELDSFTPLDRSHHMHESIPGAELLVLPGATHVGPLELPDTVIGAMEKFFRAHKLDFERDVGATGKRA